MAVTDHGVVQAFTDANHYIESLDKDDPFKVIYGVEGYLVDDLTDVAVNEKGQSLDDMYVSSIWRQPDSVQSRIGSSRSVR